MTVKGRIPLWASVVASMVMLSGSMFTAGPVSSDEEEQATQEFGCSKPGQCSGDDTCKGQYWEKTDSTKPCFITCKATVPNTNGEIRTSGTATCTAVTTGGGGGGDDDCGGGDGGIRDRDHCTVSNMDDCPNDCDLGCWVETLN